MKELREQLDRAEEHAASSHQILQALKALCSTRTAACLPYLLPTARQCSPEDAHPDWQLTEVSVILEHVIQ